jgi:hypothetical protein
MVELEAVSDRPESCCSSAARESCCAPEEKGQCCGPDHEAGACGCNAAEAEAPGDARFSG